MAIMTVEVSDTVVKKFSPYTVVKWSNISMEEELLKINGDDWTREVDFGGEAPSEKEVLDYLDKING